ncbi:GTP-binding protein [Rhodococcus sp. HNM0569]|uniref:GTP-binding protein n=1 Tax=Rhodococcus sp. HNM0569 TaxID=2716340 RepID=UPI00146EBD25|nr:GTP-binding protein [Rhodococcus sp. HNM0569]
MPRKRIPVVVVAGFLGAGKTSVLNHLLRNNQGVRIGVVVNDFGAVNIDSMMVAGQVDSMVSLSNGCMCCAVDNEDMDALLDQLAHPASDVDVIVVEASGLAEPRNMIRLILASENPSVVFGGLVMVVDGEQFGGTLERHPELSHHLGLADLLVLNKVDLLDDPVAADVRALVREYNPQAPILPASHGRIDPTVLFDPAARGEPLPGEQLTLDQLLVDGEEHQHLHADYQAVVFESASPMDPRALVEFLETRPPGIFRAKGFVHFAVPGQTRKFEVQTVGPHIRFVSARWSSGEQRATSLVLIGVDVDEAEVLAALASCVDVGDGDDPTAMLGVHRYTVAA